MARPKESGRIARWVTSTRLRSSRWAAFFGGVEEDDLAVGRRRDPAGGGPQDPADAEDLGGEAQVPALGREDLEPDRLLVKQADPRAGRRGRRGRPSRPASSVAATGRSSRACGPRLPAPAGDAGPARGSRPGPRPGRVAGRSAGVEVEPDDLAGGLAVDHVAAQGVDLQRDRRAGQAGPPADVPGRAQDGQLAFAESRRRSSGRRSRGRRARRSRRGDRPPRSGRGGRSAGRRG